MTRTASDGAVEELEVPDRRQGLAQLAQKKRKEAVRCSDSAAEPAVVVVLHAQPDVRTPLRVAPAGGAGTATAAEKPAKQPESQAESDVDQLAGGEAGGPGAALVDEEEVVETAEDRGFIDDEGVDMRTVRQ